ncbi:MAG: hypothetical protein WDO69_23950 [Pseudomonadota bacterium]
MAAEIARSAARVERYFNTSYTAIVASPNATGVIVWPCSLQHDALRSG